jgi:hypothetical protein
MKFSEKSVCIAKGRISSARVTDKGTRFIYETEGLLKVKSIPVGAVKPVFTAGELISYADDCFELENGKIEIRGNYEYVPD